MTRVLFTIVLILATLVVQAQSSATWLTTTHHFGSFSEEAGKMSYVFKMVNTTDSNMRITNVRATCGCTATQYTTKSIAPGDTASVTVTYNPVGRPGQFEKDIYVYTNASPSKSTLTIKGNVIASPSTIQAQYPESVGALRLNRHIVPFGDITKGRTRTQFINVYNSSHNSLRAEFSHVPELIKVDMIPPVASPGSTATITITYNSDKDKNWGLSQHNFTIEAIPVLHTTAAVAGIADIDITAFINENFGTLTQEQRQNAPVAKVSTDRINLGAISATDSIATATFEISNNGKSPLIIRRIYTLAKGISVSCKKTKIKPGKSAKVSVTANAAQFSNIINEKLLIITNDPTTPQQSVRIVGTINN